MWPRLIETVMGLWLLGTPLVFPDLDTSWVVHTLSCGVLVILISRVSVWGPLRWVRYGQFAVAAWLVGFGMAAEGLPDPAALQGSILTGYALFLTALLPNQVTEPPPSWQMATEGSKEYRP